MIAATASDALAALDRGGVRWSLLRPREGLARPDGDVDVLVEPEALGRVAELLGDLGFVRMPLPGPDLHASRYDERDGIFLWLHVQAALRVAGEVVPAEEVLAEADRDGVRQPSDRWLLWILLLRALVDKGELPERHREPVRRLAAAWESGPATLEALARRHGLDPAAVVSAAAAGDWDALMAQRRPPAPSGRASMPVRLARRVASIARWVRSGRSRRGLSVAVLGPDGAGKTTLVQGLARSLPLPTRIQSMGLTGGKLRRVDRLRVPGVIFLAKLAIIWLRYGRAMYRRERGEIVLFDRYLLDGVVPSGVRLGPAGRLSRSVLRRLCPMPDLVLLLDASGETMYARKGEYDAAVLESWRAGYDRLRGRLPDLEVIDAERPPDAVRRDAESRIWRRYAALRAGRAASR
jgi:thymidylate kinase